MVKKVFMLGVFALTSLSASADEGLGKQTYQTCSACHLATGEGVPGAFPALKGRLAKIAQTQAGREYIISVVLNGLSGAISVNGQAYNGFMQAYRQSFSDQQVSAVLNYVATELSASDKISFKAITSDEVAAVRQASEQSAQASYSYQLRQSAIKE